MQAVPSAQVLLLTDTPFTAQGLEMARYSLGPLPMADCSALIQEAAPQASARPARRGRMADEVPAPVTILMCGAMGSSSRLWAGSLGLLVEQTTQRQLHHRGGMLSLLACPMSWATGVRVPPGFHAAQAASSSLQLAELCEGIPGACQVVGAAIATGCMADQDFLDHPDQLHVSTPSRSSGTKLARWACPG